MANVHATAQQIFETFPKKLGGLGEKQTVGNGNPYASETKAVNTGRTGQNAVSGTIDSFLMGIGDTFSTNLSHFTAGEGIVSHARRAVSVRSKPKMLI